MTNDIRIPTLLLNEAICRRNIATMVARAQAHGLRLRPHFKTHQSHRIGRWFRDKGIDAITVSSVGMARYFADDGWDDITIAFPVNLRELDSIEALASRVKLGLLIESHRVAEQLRTRLPATDIWLKIDTGYGRTGIPWNDTALLAKTAHASTSTGSLQLRGILTHAGDTYHASGVDDIRKRFDLSRIRMRNTLSVLQPFAPETLCSVGDTPGCSLARDFTGIDEIRPGNFVFHDVMQYQLGVCRVEDIAVAVACPIVAFHDAREETLVYGGAVHLSRDSVIDTDGRRIFGLVALQSDGGWSLPLPGAYVARLSQEHGIVHLPRRYRRRLREGDLLVILPVHSCLTAECMRSYLHLDGMRIDHRAGSAGDEM